MGWQDWGHTKPTGEELAEMFRQYNVSTETLAEVLSFYARNQALWEGVKDGAKEALDFLKVAAKGLWEEVGKEALKGIAKTAWENYRE